MLDFGLIGIKQIRQYSTHQVMQRRLCVKIPQAFHQIISQVFGFQVLPEVIPGSIRIDANADPSPMFERQCQHNMDYENYQP
jgi:hypothetical protein